MNKVLIISYNFPPIAGAGVFKTLKFVKYLPDFGWQPLVLSVKKTNFAPVDSTLLDEISEKVNVYRTNSLESKVYRYAPSFFGFNEKWYQIPDSYLGWLPFVLLKGKEIIKKEAPNIIYSTSPPITNHLIALILKKKTGLPWVADFRDPFTDNYMTKYPTRFHRCLEERLESKILSFADKIVFTVDPHRIETIDRYPDINPDKFSTITNGFDHEDFKNKEIKKSKNFTLAYIGSLYGHRSPLFLLKAINMAITENESLKKDLKIIFVGRFSKEYQNMIKNFNLEKNQKEVSYVSHIEAINYMLSSSCLFFMVGLGTKSEWVLTSKIFEYMASGTPIIAAVPSEGIAGELISKSNTGIVINTDDIEGIKKALLKYYKQWKNKNLKIEPNWNIINNYERKELTKKLVNLFDELL